MYENSYTQNPIKFLLPTNIGPHKLKGFFSSRVGVLLYQMIFRFTNLNSFCLQKKSSINNNEPEGYTNGGSTLSFGTFPGEGSEVRRSRGFPALGKALLRVKTGKRSTSAPNLGEGNMSIMPEHVYHSACSVLTNSQLPCIRNCSLTK